MISEPRIPLTHGCSRISYRHIYLGTRSCLDLSFWKSSSSNDVRGWRGCCRAGDSYRDCNATTARRMDRDTVSGQLYQRSTSASEDSYIALEYLFIKESDRFDFSCVALPNSVIVFRAHIFYIYLQLFRPHPKHIALSLRWV